MYIAIAYFGNWVLPQLDFGCGLVCCVSLSPFPVSSQVSNKDRKMLRTLQEQVGNNLLPCGHRKTLQEQG